MAGPWERYAPAAATPEPSAAGPWAKYQPATEAAVAPAVTEPAAAPAPRDRFIDKASRAFDPVFQGLTFGFGDELVSALHGATSAATGGSFGEGFDRAQDVQKQELTRQRTEHPLFSIAGEAAGGLATGVGAASSGATLVGRVANTGLGSLPLRALAGAAEGGGYAALAGAGGADGGVAERATAAAKNVPVGMALGAAAVPVADLVTSGVGVARNVVTGLRNPERRGDELLVKSLMRDKQSPEALAKAIEDARAAGQPEYMAVDAGGKNTQRTGAMAAKTPGEFRNTAAETFADRQNDQARRVGVAVDDALGNTGPSAFATEQKIIADRRTAAQPLYDAAYKNPPPQDQVYTDFLGRQSVRDAIPDAERVAAEKQIPVSELFVKSIGPNGEEINQPTVRGWDFIKRELDAKVNRLYAAKQTTEAEAVKETRNQLRDRLGADVPEYGQALARYADDSAAKDAVQTGRDVVTARNPAEAIDELSKVQPKQRDLPKVGAADEINLKLAKGDPGRDRTRDVSSPDMQRRLDALIDDPVVKALFDQRVGRERDMVRSNRALFNNSNTAENAMDNADIREQGGALVSLLAGHPIRALSQFGAATANTVARGLAGMSEETAARVGKYLTSADPAEIRTLEAIFREAQETAARPSIAPAAVAAGVNAPRHPKEQSRGR